MANYNNNLKRNKPFVAFLNSLKPGWYQVGGCLLRNEAGEVTGRTPWLAHEEWWAVYVQGDKAHLKVEEVAEVAEIIAAGEDCQLTASALRFLGFIADYYNEQAGKKISIAPKAPKAEKPEKAVAMTALDALAKYLTDNNINSRKMRLAGCSDESVIAVIDGKYLEFTPAGLVVSEKKPVAKKALALAAPVDDCPF